MWLGYAVVCGLPLGTPDSIDRCMTLVVVTKTEQQCLEHNYNFYTTTPFDELGVTLDGLDCIEVLVTEDESF